MHRGLKWLGAISLLLAAASQWWPGLGNEPVSPIARSGGGTGQKRAATLPPLASAPAVDLFAAPQGAAAQQAVVPAPAMRQEVPDPPLPFEVGGTWQNREASAAAADALVVFLQSGGKTVAVCQSCRDPAVSRPGTILAGQYRLEQVAAGKIEFTRLSDGKHKFLEWMP
ncbi:hypothetical protein [Paludibacterium sp. B53371]|uniref:hypothetical protein n=1 Tax=Paludibacterium sp. B53371 TaxID=2806263 RepID=UPI001C0598E3|nr:hypothetical protein [Paludibacterium sp. B53371]